MKKKWLILYYGGLLALAFLYWLVTLIPLNFRDASFFLHFIVLTFLLLLPYLGFPITEAGYWKRAAASRERQHFKADGPHLGCLPFAGSLAGFRERLRRTKILFIPILLVVVYLLLALSGSTLLQAKRYARLIQRVEGEFNEDIAEIQFYDIPTVDRETAMRLGNKKMGEITELVSQFDVANDYTQINFQGRPTRVTPLEYADFFKWLNNRREGLPRFVRVDLISSDVELTPIAGGMKYSRSEPFLRNIRRRLRLQYPTAILGEPLFEIDEDAVPHWVTPVLTPKVGWFSGLDVKSVILTNAVDGESVKYRVEDCPTWVDRVYPSELILHQLNDNGRYQSGWLNARFGQKGVLQTTEGYNFLALDDDVFFYTGITSVTRDSSNLGFVLVNQRTKETKFYPLSSADEMSAMASAQGAVQEKEYVSTFPILLNIEGRPTYCMALKDKGQLVKMYALVDAQSYQTTATGHSIQEALTNYRLRLSTALPGDLEEETGDRERRTESGRVTDIHDVVVEGGTVYYFTLEETGEELVFSAPLALSGKLPFVTAGMEVEITYTVSALAGVQPVEAFAVR